MLTTITFDCKLLPFHNKVCQFIHLKMFYLVFPYKPFILNNSDPWLKASLTGFFTRYGHHFKSSNPFGLKTSLTRSSFSVSGLSLAHNQAFVLTLYKCDSTRTVGWFHNSSTTHRALLHEIFKFKLQTLIHLIKPLMLHASQSPPFKPVF